MQPISFLERFRDKIAVVDKDGLRGIIRNIRNPVEKPSRNISFALPQNNTINPKKSSDTTDLNQSLQLDNSIYKVSPQKRYDLYDIEQQANFLPRLKA
jgi:hypothetical protein